VIRTRDPAILHSHSQAGRTPHTDSTALSIQQNQHTPTQRATRRLQGAPLQQALRARLARVPLCGESAFFARRSFTHTSASTPFPPPPPFRLTNLLLPLRPPPNPNRKNQHPTENARRRDPREVRYAAVACPDYKQGMCLRGDTCQYAVRLWFVVWWRVEGEAEGGAN
jgi:hypothetical protein